MPQGVVCRRRVSAFSNDFGDRTDRVLTEFTDVPEERGLSLR